VASNGIPAVPFHSEVALPPVEIAFFCRTCTGKTDETGAARLMAMGLGTRLPGGPGRNLAERAWQERFAHRPKNGGHRERYLDIPLRTGASAGDAVPWTVLYGHIGDGLKKARRTTCCGEPRLQDDSFFGQAAPGRSSVGAFNPD